MSTSQQPKHRVVFDDMGGPVTQRTDVEQGGLHQLLIKMQIVSTVEQARIVLIVIVCLIATVSIWVAQFLDSDSQFSKPVPEGVLLS